MPDNDIVRNYVFRYSTVMIRAILFDMDGVLLDSEVFICQAAIAYLAECGITAEPEDFIPFVGAGENRYIGEVARRHGLEIEDIDRAKERTYALYAELVRGKLTPLPGVRDFITEARRMGMKTAVATSADYTKLAVNLQEIGMDHGEFDVLVNGLDVERRKPFPDIYLLAAQSLSVPPHECIVFEDAPNGVQAAKAAGCACAAVTTSFPEKVLYAAGADRVFSDFTQISSEKMRELLL
jgi:beta-phosphoglucomutase